MSHKGLDRTHPCEATDLCDRLDRPRELDAVGNRGFSGAANAARGLTHRKAPRALILMGDWCAAAQPLFENQVCGELGGPGMRNTGLARKRRGGRRNVFALLTEAANG